MSDEESDEEQQVLQVRDRARTMNVQRPDEPRHAYTPLALVLPASVMLRFGTMAPNARTMGRSPGHMEAARRRSHIIAGTAPRLWQCSVAARDACGGPAVSQMSSAQRVAFASRGCS